MIQMSENCAFCDNSNSIIQELNAIFKYSYDGIGICDADGFLLRANSAYEKITGVKVGQFIGRKVRDIVEEGYVSFSVVEQVIKHKQKITLLNTTADKRKFLITGIPVFDDNGELWRIVVNTRDIKLFDIKQKLEDIMSRYEFEIANVSKKEHFDEIIATSELMKNVLARADKASKVESTVLITGETGVGKELIANIIHNSSQRRENPFIKINCAAIPENLLESELFGYEKGAFTGANQNGKVGLFEAANDGTIFLDEIGDVSSGFQVRLLRVIQEKEYIRVGGIKPHKLNVRVISSTNKNFESMVKEGKFREDLFYRLNVLPIIIPPLRQRGEDIPYLVHYFLNKFNQKHNMSKRISAEVLKVFKMYSWPGNIRELENLIEQLVVLSEDNEITTNCLPFHLQNIIEHIPKTTKIVPGLFSLKEAVEEVEKCIIEKALELGQNTRKAAELLGVNQSTIVRRAQKYKIRLPMKRD